MSQHQSRPDWTAYAILTVMPLMFSSNLVIGRAAMETMAPATLAFWRWFLAGLFLLPFVGMTIWRNRSKVADALPTLAVLGFLGMTICGTFVYVALRHTTATNATLIYTTSPIFIILLERVFRARPLRMQEFSGIIVAFVGIVVILTRGDLTVLKTFGFNLGDVGMVIAAISWAVYSVILKNGPVAALPTPTAFSLIALVGAATILPSFALEGLRSGFLPRTMQEWTSVFGVVVFASVGAFLSYQIGVRRVGPTITSIFMYLLPIYGVAMSVVFLGESLRTFHLVGIVLVLSGVILATIPGEMVRRLRPV